MKIKNYLKILLTAFIILPTIILAQGVAINDDDSEADPSAMLDVKSTDKGVLFPRLTKTQILSINSPANGLVVFNLNDNRLYFFDGSDQTWRKVDDSSVIFDCGDLLHDDRDEQTYTTVQIGSQCWMAENLNIGDQIPGSQNMTNNGTIEKYCYDNNSSKL